MLAGHALGKGVVWKADLLTWLCRLITMIVCNLATYGFQNP